MSQHRKNHILTLVCTLIFLLISQLSGAAPSSDFPPDRVDSGLHPRTTKDEPAQPSPPMDFNDSTQITPATGPLTKQAETRLIPTRKLTDEATFVAIGLWEGAIVDKNLNNNLVYLRIGESVYENVTTATEYTFDITTQGDFGWSAGYKFLQDLGRNYEPYLKLALAALYTSNEGLGTFINWQRYQIRGEIGCDDLFQMQRSLRGELGASWSGYGFGLYGGVAYAF